MELGINDLGSVLTTVFKATIKWYNIGLMLKVAVPTLERIRSQFDDPTDGLREMLKAWLETAEKPTWRDIVDALRGVTVGYSKLASDIETRYCTAETGQAGGQTIPDVQPQRKRFRATNSIQQALEHSQELLRIKDQQLQDSQRHMHTLQQELQESQMQIKELTHNMEKKTNSCEVLKYGMSRQSENFELPLTNSSGNYSKPNSKWRRNSMQLRRGRGKYGNRMSSCK